ncbi:MAG: electron transfer flavoprotein subunit alpha/FixB family protein, partial [Methylibium sp.]|nr:electron transfer flavoprotein subunit alpha/FixB family protein [Methylibium sp.]
MAQGILVIAEHRQQALRAVSLELIAATQGVLSALGDKITVAVIGQGGRSHAAALSVAGVDELVFIDTPDTEFDADTWEAAIAALAAETQPALILVAHSVDSMAYAAALAVKHDYGFATDVFGLDSADGALVATRGGYGQKLNVELEFPGRATVLLAVRPGSFKPPQAAAQPATRDFAFTAKASRTKNVAYIE